MEMLKAIEERDQRLLEAANTCVEAMRTGGLEQVGMHMMTPRHADQPPPRVVMGNLPGDGRLEVMLTESDVFLNVDGWPCREWSGAFEPTYANLLDYLRDPGRTPPKKRG